MNVSNVLSEEKKKQVIALGQLGWTLRRIEKETGVRRETAAAYLKTAGIAVRPPGKWGRCPPEEASAECTVDPVPEQVNGMTPEPERAEPAMRGHLKTGQRVG